MPTKPVKISVPITKLNTEMFKEIPRLRLDSSNLLYLKIYKEIIERIRSNRVEVTKMEELIKPLSRRLKPQKIATIMVRSLWKLSISPIKLEIRQQGFFREVPLHALVIVITGQAIGKVSMVPKYLNNILFEFLGVNNVATTGDISVFLPNKDEYIQYLDAFLNTSLGQVILELSKYGTTNQHIDLQIFIKQYVPLILVNKIAKLLESSIEEYEAKAWRAYFKAMKIVEEYLKIEDIGLTGISTMKIMRNVGRIDAAIHLLLSSMASKIGEENIHYIGKFYDIISGTAPSSRKYEEFCKGQKYISTKSIDESGYIDDESFYCYPGQLKTRSFAKKGSLVILKNAHTVEALGKVGVVYPYDNVSVISDLYILNPKLSIDEGVSFYINALSKTKLFKQIIQLLAYGLTAHIRAEDLAKMPIPFIEQWEEVAKYMKEFFLKICIKQML